MESRFNIANRASFFTQYADIIAGWIVALLSMGAILFPRAIPFFFLSLALMAVVELWRTGRTSDVFKTPDIFWILASFFTAWCFITILWSSAPQQALEKVFFLASTLLAAWVVYCWHSNLSPLMSAYLKLGLLAGTAIAGAIIAIEAFSGLVITKTLLNLFEFLRPDGAKHVKTINNEVQSLGNYLLNRNVATLNLLLWPAILISSDLQIGKWSSIFSAALIAIVALATFNSAHESSMIALLVGGAIFAIYYYVPRAGHIASILIWIAAVVLIIPAALMAKNASLHEAEWIPLSAQARIVLWANTAKKYPDNPLLGVGVYTTQSVDDRRNEDVKGPRKHHYHNISTARHSHNIFMQTWYELGALGAMLLLATGLALLSRINRLPDSVKPLVAAAFTGATIIASLTWGLWQVWFIAMFAYGGAAMLIATHQDSKPIFR